MHPFVVTVLVCLAIVAVSIFMMRKGWHTRKERQHHVGVLAEVPQSYDDRQVIDVVEGTYVCTTVSGDWLDRIVVHTLGVKSQARMLFYDDALIIERTGARDIWIHAHLLKEARLGSGMNGKFVEKDGLLIITWELNHQWVDTGVRTQYSEDVEEALNRLNQLIAHNSSSREEA